MKKVNRRRPYCFLFVGSSSCLETANSRVKLELVLFSSVWAEFKWNQLDNFSLACFRSDRVSYHSSYHHDWGWHLSKSFNLHIHNNSECSTSRYLCSKYFTKQITINKITTFFAFIIKKDSMWTWKKFVELYRVTSILFGFMISEY